MGRWPAGRSGIFKTRKLQQTYGESPQFVYALRTTIEDQYWPNLVLLELLHLLHTEVHVSGRKSSRYTSVVRVVVEQVVNKRGNLTLW